MRTTARTGGALALFLCPLDRTNQMFPVAVAAEDRAVDHADDLPTLVIKERPRRVNERGDLLITSQNAPAFANRLRPEFELRLDQRHKRCIWACKREGWRQGFAEADETDVADNKLDSIRNHRTGEVARVRLLEIDDARVAGDFDVKLTVADIDRVDFRSARAQEQIRETAGRGAKIKTSLPCRVDVKRPKRRLQFDASARNERVDVPCDLDFGVCTDCMTRFRRNGTVDANEPAANRGLRPGARPKIPALNENFIEPSLFSVIFH